MKTIPHRLDPLATQDTEDDHKRVHEVAKMPAQRDSVELLRSVVVAEKLHPHDGEYEDDDRQDETEVTESSHRPTDYPDQQIQRRPRFRQLENSKLDRNKMPK